LGVLSGVLSFKVSLASFKKEANFQIISYVGA
jgi:hypothetical protein